LLESLRETFLEMKDPARDEPVHKNVTTKVHQGIPT
jgi:hypothetical protein